MTTAPLPATSDLMTMLCRIGAGMREAMPSGVYLQFLLIGAMCPEFGSLLRAWLFVEERLADRLEIYEADLQEDDGDTDLCSGWLSQEGPVWRWRHVTRFGSRLVIPVLWFVERDCFDGLPPQHGSRVCAVAGVAAGVVAGVAAAAGATPELRFLPGLAAGVELRAIRSALLTKRRSWFETCLGEEIIGASINPGRCGQARYHSRAAEICGTSFRI